MDVDTERVAARGRAGPSELCRNYHTRALSFFKRGDWDHAIADCDLSIVQVPDDVSCYYLRGQSYRRKGDAARAAADEKMGDTLLTAQADADVLKAIL